MSTKTRKTFHVSSRRILQFWKVEFICEDYLAEQNNDDVFATELIFCNNPQCYTAHSGVSAPHVIRSVSRLTSDT